MFSENEYKTEIMKTNKSKDKSYFRPSVNIEMYE